jgi:glycerol-3-phosphate dehydrogenase
MQAAETDHDIVVIGGGINGCGIARDAAGRGYSVFLAEMNDLASGTSSLSTKLVHGGLRYLEHFHLRLVREALIEREVLWSNAPHIIRPLRFVLPHRPGFRPRWMLRLGLFVYDHLGGRRVLPPTATLDLAADPAGAPLKDGFGTAFEYSDCWVDDARLVVLNARDAADRGAEIRTRSEATAIEPAGGRWRVLIHDHAASEDYAVTARVVVNAAGPWVGRVLARTAGADGEVNVRLVQGSHIVVPRLFAGPRCYILQNSDRRVVFAIPFEEDFTLIGTTDRDYEGDPGEVRITPAEILYLCAAVGAYFRTPVSADEIVWSYSGVRPLFDDGSARAQEATRDYVLRQAREADGAAMINVFGGKITTYRKLSEAVLEMVEDHLGARSGPWTGSAPLPGGDFAVGELDTLARRFADERPFLAAAHVRRLIRAYGTRAVRAIGHAASTSELGRHFGADLYEAEIRYLVAEEWALSADDILWRRTKRGLELTADEAGELRRYVASLVEAEAARDAPARSRSPDTRP